MTTHKILHTCGCEVIYNLTEEGKDLEKKLRQLKRGKCTPHWKEEADKVYLTTDKGDKLDIYTLPKFDGSPLQISWAKKIRAQVITKIESTPESNIGTIATLMSKETDCSWWIDRRNNIQGIADYFISLSNEKSNSFYGVQ